MARGVKPQTQFDDYMMSDFLPSLLRFSKLGCFSLRGDHQMTKMILSGSKRWSDERFYFEVLSLIIVESRVLIERPCPGGKFPVHSHMSTADRQRHNLIYLPEKEKKLWTSDFPTCSEYHNLKEINRKLITVISARRCTTGDLPY